MFLRLQKIWSDIVLNVFIWSEGFHFDTNGPFVLIVPSPRSQETGFSLLPHLLAEGLSWPPLLDLSGLPCSTWLVVAFLPEGRGRKKWLIVDLLCLGGLWFCG